MKKILLLSLVLITMSACSSGKVKTSAEETATPASVAASHNVGCPAGCYRRTCGGVAICVKNKPAPLCTPC